MYDLIIVGAGPAGLTASIYASCYHISHLVIGGVFGGQLSLAPDILNYPGFEEISGKELTDRLVGQVKTRGGEIVTDSVVKIVRSNINVSQRVLPRLSLAASAPSPSAQSALAGALPGVSPVTNFEIETQSGKKYQAKAIILATGTERRKLNVPGEVKYTSRGIHYCATCEKLDYKDKVCGIVGGANSAVQAAVEVAQAASHVYIIYRGRGLRGDPIWLTQADKNPKIEMIFNTAVTEIIGDEEKVTGVRLKSTVDESLFITQRVLPRLSLAASAPSPSAQSALAGPLPGVSPVGTSLNKEVKLLNGDILSLDKLFVEIGGVPGTALVIPLGVEMDKGGFIKVNDRMETNIPGIFAAGDLVSYGLSIEQISSAVGLGARAAASAFSYLKNEHAPSLWGKAQIKR